MRVRRALLVVVGLLLAGAAFAMVLSPGLAAGLSLERSVAVVVAAAAGFQAYRVIRSRYRATPELAETGDPETEQDLPVPGDDFDEAVANAGGHYRPRRPGDGPGVVRGRDRVTRRLEEAAVATITRKYGCTEREAQAILDDGTWTDDPFAAAFFTGTVRGVGLGTRIRTALSGEGQFERQATRAARAIADLADREEGRLPDADAGDGGEVTAQ